jgi:energy-coupling factor transporter ATP-binding protein EcfA2
VAAIELENLGFRYRSRRAPALQALDVSLEQGQTLAVLGPSGSGKSTLALCLNGLIPHRVPGELKGSVKIAGRDTRDASPAELARQVGVVFQDPDTQFCMLRVEDEVAFGLENLHVPRADMRPRIERALAQVGLAGCEAARIDRLSGGQKQRLALAATLVLEPDVMVLDEPTANLDPAGASNFFEYAARFKRSHGLVLIEHRVEHVLPMADLVLVLGPDGAPVALGPPREVLSSEWPRLVEYGVWLPEVAELALRSGEREASRIPLTVDEAVTYFAGWRTPVCQPEPTLSASAAVRIENLSFAYGNGPRVLRDVSCAMPEAQLTAIVGPNGSGKSTLVAHLAGIFKPNAGGVSVFGYDGRALARRPDPRLVGFVFQNPELQFLTNRVLDEVAWGPRRLGLAETEAVARCVSELEQLGLGHLAQVNPYRLSGGEKRRLSLATALVLQPRLLVLDEPTFGQDRATSAALMERLRALRHAGTTIVVVTHDMRLVANEAHHVVLLVGGAVAYEGPPDWLLDDPGLMQAGNLVRPPLLELARRLGLVNTSTALATVDGWLTRQAVA